ncbi:hypothetical protein [Ferribacterium limneticum]|uniref:hypothetical protein n=1 Tax=Ferribacterium limneticum TaxID=76259 RepID=UPI001CFA0F96|nr:hypothetical protein [Ferribacterium limneticum]UCV29104.1 hypothetical protein KI617_03105 [Ferribacterium limneticum]UCV33022.1 hypothetical protein KI608_03105 [Ferribacterium limneticum]
MSKMEKIGYFELAYQQIPAYADEAKNGRTVRLKLGRFRGALYRWLVQREINSRLAKPGTLRFAVDLALMLFVLLVAKRLILLAYYHEESLEAYQSIRFEPAADGVFVWFIQPEIRSSKHSSY